MRHVLLAALVLATPASAGVEEALAEHALPGTARFAEVSGDLAEAAREDCTAEALKPAWNDAFDAYLGIQHLRFGPLEEQGRGLAILFWPDTRGMIPRTLDRILAEEDPVVDDPDGFAEVSIAARGLMAMERLLYDPDVAGYGPDTYACALARAQAVDLARMADGIASEWRDFAQVIRSAGEPGNDTFLSAREPRQAFYTALTTGLEMVDDQRLGRPLGGFDDPRPRLAEARRSGRSLRNVERSLEGLRDLARALAPGDIPATEAAFDTALETAGRIEAPDLSGVADPMARFVIESLQQDVTEIRRAVAEEIGVPLGVSAGFNSADGD